MGKTTKINGGIVLLMFMVFATFLSGCASAPHIEEVTIPDNFEQTVPIVSKGKKWVLPVVINDVELNLYLDTGATQIVLVNNRRTKTFFENANSFAKTRGFDASIAPVKSKAMKNATLSMDGFPDQIVKVTLMDGMRFPQFHLRRIDGSIGYELLSKYDVRIDKRKLLATFMKAGTLKRQANTNYFPIKLVGKMPVFEGALRFPYADQDEKLSVIIDTGSDSSIMIQTQEDVRAETVMPTKETSVWGIMGEVKYTNIPDVVITATEGNFSLKAEARVKINAKVKTRATIGMPALSGDIIEISYKSKFISAGDANDPPS